jgi:hypothetical protein
MDYIEMMRVLEKKGLKKQAGILKGAFDKIASTYELPTRRSFVPQYSTRARGTTGPGYSGRGEPVEHLMAPKEVPVEVEKARVDQGGWKPPKNIDELVKLLKDLGVRLPEQAQNLDKVIADIKRGKLASKVSHSDLLRKMAAGIESVSVHEKHIAPSIENVMENTAPATGGVAKTTDPMMENITKLVNIYEGVSNLVKMFQKDFGNLLRKYDEEIAIVKDQSQKDDVINRFSAAKKRLVNAADNLIDTKFKEMEIFLKR